MLKIKTFGHSTTYWTQHTVQNVPHEEIPPTIYVCYSNSV